MAWNQKVDWPPSVVFPKKEVGFNGGGGSFFFGTSRLLPDSEDADWEALPMLLAGDLPGNRRHEPELNGDEGFTIWMTGLPGSGKSTLAAILAKTLTNDYRRKVELLDGDEIRKGLSRDLGLSKEDREEHARRVAFVAKLLSRNDVVSIVALISPYRRSRAEARETIGPSRFVEIYVKASLEECERRDPKGLYAKARRGEIDNMTGIQHPYEPPEHAEIVVDTEVETPESCVKGILAGLRRLGKLTP